MKIILGDFRFDPDNASHKRSSNCDIEQMLENSKTDPLRLLLAARPLNLDVGISYALVPISSQ